MTKQPTRTPGGQQIWHCDGCGRTSLWTDEHEWYGSYKEVDDGDWSKVIVTCSAECKQATAKAGEAAARELARPKAVK